MNILVTGIGGDIGQSVVKCLRESFADARLIGCDKDDYAASRLDVDVFAQSPDALNSVEYVSFVHKLIDSDKVDYVFPITEVEIDLFNRYRTFFGNTTVLINRPVILDTFFDKYETVRFLKHNKLPCPKTYLIEDFDDQLSYPVLVKARRTWGSKGVVKIDGPEDLEYYRKKMPDSVVQEILGTIDDEYTVGVFSDGAGVHSICFRRYLGYGSISKFVELVYCAEVHELVTKIARICGLVGCMNVQLRKTDRGYVPFEINARLSSTVYFRHCFGFQDVKWWLDVKEGRPVSYEPKYRSGIGVRTIGEVFFDMEEL